MLLVNLNKKKECRWHCFYKLKIFYLLILPLTNFKQMFHHYIPFIPFITFLYPILRFSVAQKYNIVRLISLREKCLYSEFFWSVFSGIRAEYGEIQSVFLYSDQMRGNMDQKNSKYGHFSCKLEIGYQTTGKCSHAQKIRIALIKNSESWCSIVTSIEKTRIAIKTHFFPFCAYKTARLCTFLRSVRWKTWFTMVNHTYNLLWNPLFCRILFFHCHG